MPSISNTGRIGAGSSRISADGRQFDSGAGGTGFARWVDNDRLIYQRPNDRVVVSRPDLSDITSLDRGASDIAAGGGHYATWLAGDGLRHSRDNGWLQNAGLKDVGRDGTLAFCPSRQSGVGLNFTALQDDNAAERRFFSLPDVIALECSVLSWGRAVWRNEKNETWVWLDGRVVGPLPVVGPTFHPRLLSVDNEWWIAYHTNEEPTPRLLLQPITSDHGFVLVNGPTFNVDALATPPELVLLAWATTEAEWPEQIVSAGFNVKTHRMTMTGRTDEILLDYVKLERLTGKPPIVVVEPPIIVEPPKEKPVQLEERGVAIVNELYEQNKTLAESKDDNDRRILAKKIAEQCRFELGEDYGWKSNHGNTENDAPSKDAIAKKRGPYVPGRQMLWIFDLFNGTTRRPNINIQSVPEDESNQFFIPVQPVNHLGVGEPPVVVEPPIVVEPPVVVDPKPDTALAARVDALARQLSDAIANVNLNFKAHDAAISEMRQAVKDINTRLDALATPGTPKGDVVAATEKTLLDILAILRGLAGNTTLRTAA